MPDFSNTYFLDLAEMHGFSSKHAVKQYVENTKMIAGEYLEQAGIDLDRFKGRILPIKIVVFLRKINPTWEDMIDEELKKVSFHQLFPDKFPETPPNTPQTLPQLPPEPENE